MQLGSECGLHAGGKFALDWTACLCVCGGRGSPAGSGCASFGVTSRSTSSPDKFFRRQKSLCVALSVPPSKGAGTKQLGRPMKARPHTMWLGLPEIPIQNFLPTPPQGTLGSLKCSHAQPAQEMPWLGQKWQEEDEASSGRGRQWLKAAEKRKTPGRGCSRGPSLPSCWALVCHQLPTLPFLTGMTGL